jgi:hypothetical protein
MRRRGSGRTIAGMKSLLLTATLALAMLLPATAGARPLYDSEVSTPSPVVAPADGGGGESVFGYLVVGLGGLALGAGLSRVVSARRVLAPAHGGH